MISKLKYKNGIHAFVVGLCLVLVVGLNQAWTSEGEDSIKPGFTKASSSTSAAVNCPGSVDSILCLDWLNDALISFCCPDPGPSATLTKIYLTEYNGDQAILIDNSVNCNNPSAFGGGFDLYDCQGTKIDSCTYAGFNTTCNHPPSGHPVIGPAYTAANLIYDSSIDTVPLCPSNRPFITTWQTDNPGTSCSSCITIPTFDGACYNYEVDWDNDGVFDQLGITEDVTHDFGSPGTYTIAIRGDFPRIYFNDEGDKEKITNIDQWGDVHWESMNRAFWNCSKLNSNAQDTPDLSNVTDMGAMFQGTAFNSDIGNWNTGNVTRMGFMFAGADAFNQDIGNWNTENVTHMDFMFAGADAFNQDISSWNTENVTIMSIMFSDALAFNQDISNWNLNSVTDLESMFDDSGMDCENYSATLIGWAANPNTPDDLTLGAEGMEYGPEAISARNILLNKGWVIEGDNQGSCIICDHPDYDALMALFNNTGGDYWYNNLGYTGNK